jgi:hypothetical protein
MRVNRSAKRGARRSKVARRSEGGSPGSGMCGRLDEPASLPTGRRAQAPAHRAAVARHADVRCRFHGIETHASYGSSVQHSLQEASP